MNFFGKIKKGMRITAALIATMMIFTLATVYAAVAPDEVEIHCDGKVIVVEKTSKSVYNVLLSNGISLGTYDSVKPGLDVSVENIDKIIVRRAVNVTLTDNGITTSYMTSAESVGEFLEVKGFPADPYDIVEPSLNTSITKDMSIEVVRCERVVTEETVEIPYETEKHDHSDIAKGLVSVRQYGVPGSKVCVRETIYREGEVVFDGIIKETVKKQPVKEILDVGTKANTVVAPDGTVYTYSKMITCTATAYDASYESNGPWGPITATGKALDSGMVAVDPRVIPLGTKLYIESPDGTWVYGYSVAEDTGGAIKGNKVDLFFHSPYDVRQFGRRTANVYILN